MCATRPVILLIISAEYGKNPSRIIHAVERIRRDTPYVSSFIAKLWLNELENIALFRSYRADLACGPHWRTKLNYMWYTHPLKCVCEVGLYPLDYLNTNPSVENIRTHILHLKEHDICVTAWYLLVLLMLTKINWNINRLTWENFHGVFPCYIIIQYTFWTENA